MSDLVNENCNFKSWETLKNEYHLDNKLYFQWMQLIHAIPLIWKQKINDTEKNVEKKYIVQDHRLIKNTRVITLEKLTAREIYPVLNYLQVIHQPPKNISAKFFQRKTSTGRKFFILPRVVTIIAFNVVFNTKYFVTYHILIGCSLPLVK